MHKSSPSVCWDPNRGVTGISSLLFPTSSFVPPFKASLLSRVDSPEGDLPYFRRDPPCILKFFSSRITSSDPKREFQVGGHVGVWCDPDRGVGPSPFTTQDDTLPRRRNASSASEAAVRGSPRMEETDGALRKAVPSKREG